MSDETPGNSPAPPAPSATHVRLLVVDDHPVVRSGIVGMLEGEADLEVVGQTCDGREALDQPAGESRPLSNTAGCVLDPVVAIRCAFTVSDDAPGQCHLVTGADQVVLTGALETAHLFASWRLAEGPAVRRPGGPPSAWPKRRSARPKPFTVCSSPTVVRDGFRSLNTTKPSCCRPTWSSSMKSLCSTWK